MRETTTEHKKEFRCLETQKHTRQMALYASY